jgi:hypothetical protein
VDPTFACLTSVDPVAARLALKFLLDRIRHLDSAAMSAGCELSNSHITASINLKDPLARVYYVQMCSMVSRINSPRALQTVANMIESEMSFRVVLECVSVLCDCLLWNDLVLLRTPSIVPIIMSKVKKEREMDVFHDFVVFDTL